MVRPLRHAESKETFKENKPLKSAIQMPHLLPHTLQQCRLYPRLNSLRVRQQVGALNPHVKEEPAPTLFHES